MSYRLINANDLNGKISDKDYELVLNAPCIYADLPNGLDGEYHEIPKWIPVSERLPEDGEKVVVTLEDGDARTMTFYRSNNDWWFETDERWEYKAMARAWMPSYKEGE